MSKFSVAIAVTITLSAVSVAADYFLKRASQSPTPFQTSWFWAGLLIFSATAFGWVFVMRHLKFATIGVCYSISTVLLLTVVGVVLLRESLHWKEIVGLAFALASIILLVRFS